VHSLFNCQSYHILYLYLPRPIDSTIEYIFALLGSYRIRKFKTPKTFLFCPLSRTRTTPQPASRTRICLRYRSIKSHNHSNMRAGPSRLSNPTALLLAAPLLACFPSALAGVATSTIPALPSQPSDIFSGLRVKRDGTAYENPNLNGGSMLTVSVFTCDGGAQLICSG
jgi:hypothetical protein